MKLTLLASSLFIVAACGGKSKPAGPGDPPPDNGGGEEAQAYGALFTQGASWQLELTTEDSSYDEETGDTGGMEKAAPVLVTCEVAQFAEAAGVKSIEIVCGNEEGEAGADPLSGYWAMNEKGVWRLPAWPAEGEAPGLLDEAMAIAAAPVAGVDEQDDSENGGEYSKVTIERKGDAWCKTEVYAMGDESWMSLCVGPDGPTEANWGWGGGSVHEAWFVRK